jgi:flagellar hook-length control protein FliK
MAAKTPNESAFAPLPAAPAAPTTVTRPMSETVMAQNTLAANGNAMEKVLSHQVSKALVQHLPNGDRVLVMRLTPPELGTVKIEVIERMGVLTAKLHAEDDGVRLALERFLPSMRQDLRASDAPIRELSMSDQTQFQRSFADGQNQQQQQQNAESSNRRARADEPRFNTDAARSDAVVATRSAPLGGRVSMSEVNALA